MRFLVPTLLLFAACGVPVVRPATRPYIVAVEGGDEVSIEGLARAIASARVVYVGEEHDRESDHRAQLTVIEALRAREPAIAIGLEMVQQPHQAALDAYVAGEIDEATMLAQVEWEERWGFDFALYRPIFELARAHHIPIVALNARQEITRTVGRRGLDALSEEERAELPELDLSNAAHRAMVEEALRGHPRMDAAMLERFYTAQVIWDETMADRAARFLNEHPEVRHMVVLAGAMHVEAGFGIPARAARRGAAPYAIVMPILASELEEALLADPRIADYLWVTP